MLQLLVTVCFAGFALTLGFLAFKLRKVHLMLYRIENDSQATRGEVATLFGQLQALQSLDRLLKLEHGLPPLRGWAGSPDMLLQLAQRLRHTRPAVVLECSSGASTIVAARCCQLNGIGHVYSLEHDEAYAQKTRYHLARQGLGDQATVVYAPLEVGTDGAHWYRDSALPAEATGAELLVVDGPPAGGDSEARFPALPRLRARLNSRFAIMLDDADRPGEREVVARWLKLDSTLQAEWLPCEKGLAVVETRN